MMPAEAAGDLYEDLQARMQRSLIPWDGAFELTYRCNERCAMCYLGPDWGKGRKKDELTTAEVFDALDQIRDAGCLELLLTGGEVCLRPDILDIINYAGSRGFLLTVKTNGTMVTDEFVATLRRNPVKQVDMSLLGACAETHDAVTKIPRSFDRTLAAIRLTRSHDVAVHLYFTALNLNFREVAQARRLAESLGCVFEWSSQVQPRDDRSVIPLTLRLDKDAEGEVQRLKTAEMLESNGNKWEPSGYSQERSWFCGAGRYSFNINPYGEVQPCTLMRMDCGNLREQTFVDIWQNAPEFKRLRALTLEEVYGCSRCGIRDYCSACPGLFFMEMGDVTIPSPHICQQTELKHEVATGTYKPAGSRDAQGSFPRAANAIFGGVGHQPIALHRSQTGAT